MHRRACFHSRDNRLKVDPPSAPEQRFQGNAGPRISTTRISTGEKRRMSSRALSLATVLLLTGLLAAGRGEAQENLDAGKSPSQIFAGTCTACHKSPRGLLKTVSPSSLSNFLRQHYTTSPNMAGVLASYLISNGATDTRLSGTPPKGAKEGTKEEAKQEA